MKIFDIIGDKITLNPQSLFIPEFKALYTRDRSNGKTKCYTEIAYVVFLCDNSGDNPYSNFSKEERHNILALDYKVDIDDAIKKAIDKFEKLNTTRYERVVMAALDSLTEVENYYRTIKKSDNFDILEYLNTTEKLGKAFDSLKKLENSIHTDRVQTSKGNNEIGDYEV
jgi:hypothetical protein